MSLYSFARRPAFVLAACMALGVVLCAWFGARVRAVDGDLAEALGLARPGGLQVEEL